MHYKNGKIYQILNTENNKVYIGSTCTQLSRRMVHHRKCSLSMSSLLYDEMKNLGIDKFYIELLEAFPCNNKDELIARENALIRERGTALNSLSSYKAKAKKKQIDTASESTRVETDNDSTKVEADSDKDTKVVENE